MTSRILLKPLGSVWLLNLMVCIIKDMLIKFKVSEALTSEIYQI